MKTIRDKQFNYSLDSSNKEGIQQKQLIDFWAKGYNYDKPGIIDPSSFHTQLKLYRNPEDVSVAVSSNGSAVPDSKEFVFTADDASVVQYISLDISSNAVWFDASVEFLNTNEAGWWIGSSQIGEHDSNTDIWEPADKSEAYPKAGSVMVWKNTVGLHKDVSLHDENGVKVFDASYEYDVPSRVHIKIYPRDFTGVKARSCKVTLTAHTSYVDNFAVWQDSSVGKIAAKSASSTLYISQAGVNVVFSAVADETYSKNDLSYFKDSAGNLIPLEGQTVSINTLYPSSQEDGTEWQYFGIAATTNAKISSIRVLNDADTSVASSIAGVFNTADSLPFSGFTPDESNVKCLFYVRIKKYEITNAAASDPLAKLPIIYKVSFTLDDGSSPYWFKIKQYGYIADDTMRVYDYYTGPQTLTEEEQAHSTPETKVETNGTYISESYIFPIYQMSDK